MNALLEEADELDNYIRVLSSQVLALRHEYLFGKGWVIASQIIGPSVTHVYRKDDNAFTCEHDAVEYETETVMEAECPRCDHVFEFQI